MLPEQMVASTPALTIATGFIVKTKASLTEEQTPAGSSVVSVKVAVPAATSSAEGVKVAVTDVGGVKTPVPGVVQVEELAPPPIPPNRPKVLPEHIVASSPALTVAAGFIVNTITSLADKQEPEGSLVVMVKVTTVPLISLADGVYTGVKEVLLLKLPLPDVVQV